MDPLYDTLIIGAGPAGSAAARTLAAAGLRTLILEKSPWPRYKTCGGGILGRATAEIFAAGLTLDSVAERTFHRLDMHLLNSNRRFTAERPHPIVRMAMRSALDAALLAAATNAGAEFRPNTPLTALILEKNSLLIRTPAGDFRARYLIAADGANSPTARLAGWSAQKHLAAALEWEVQVPPAQLAAHTAARFDFDLPPDGYAWVFPKRSHLSIGVVSVRRRCKDLNAACAAYMQKLNIDSTRIDRHGFVIPTRPRPEGLSRGRVLLAGDAAGLADPVTLEGISHALLSGRLAAESIAAHPASPESVRRAYRAAIESEILSDLRPAAILSRLLYGPAKIRTALFQRHGETFVDLMTDIASGRRRYRDLLRRPANYLKLLRL